MLRITLSLNDVQGRRLLRHAALLSLLFFWPLNGVSLGQGIVKSVHKEWQIRCDTLPGEKKEQCAIIQGFVSETRPNIFLTIIVIKSEAQKNTILRAVVPQGTFLPSGLGLKIDNDEIGSAAFVRCVLNGCIAEVTLEPELVAKLRKGKRAVFSFFQSPDQGDGFPVNLDGFREAYDALQ
jgi:invasion protein IalB